MTYTHYTPKDWQDGTNHETQGASTTPISAVALEDAETRLSDYTEEALGKVGGLAGLVNVMHPEYGAVGNDSTDDTAALQGALDAAPDGALVLIPPYTFKITAPLVIDHPLTLVGTGVSALWGSQADDFNSIGLPTVSPFLAGSVLNQVTAGEDAIQITETGVQVDLANFGIRFGGLTYNDSVAFRDTGHGINALPPAYNGRYDNGVSGARWDGIQVYGHDGDHVAFRVVNGIYNSFSHLRSFGGGALLLIQDAGGVACFYGNFYCEHLWGYVVAGGTAHGIEVRNTDGQPMTSLGFYKPQINVAVVSNTLDYAGAAPQISEPTDSQKTFYCPDAQSGLSIFLSDFESGVGAGSNPVYPSAGHWFQDSGSWSDGMTQTYSGVFASRPAATDRKGASFFDVDLGMPIFSDGRVWVDGTGRPVYRSVMIADGALSYWRLSETGATTADQMGVNTGTYVGAGLTKNQDGGLVLDPDGSLQFPNDSGNYVRVKSGRILASLTDASIEALINLAAVPSGFPVIYSERAAAGNDIFNLAVNDAGKLLFTFRDDAGTLNQVTGTAVVADGAWHHVVLTKAGTAVVLYVDGEQDKTGTLTATDTFTNAGTEARIGGDAGDAAGAYPNDATPGYIDELSVWDWTLAPANVAYHYRATGLGGFAN